MLRATDSAPPLPSPPTLPLPAVPFGQLPKEERKAINKVVHKDVRRGGLDGATVCVEEIGMMLLCFERADWETQPCAGEIETMYACVDAHKHDPDPKQLIASWQKGIRQKVFHHFVKQKVLPRLLK